MTSGIGTAGGVYYESQSILLSTVEAPEAPIVEVERADDSQSVVRVLNDVMKGNYYQVWFTYRGIKV